MDKAVKKRLSKEQKRYLFLGAIILAFFILFSIRIPNFFQLVTITNLVRQSAVILILSIGMMLVILTGGIDLSVGATMALSGAAAAVTIQTVGEQSVAGAAAGMAAALLVGALVGAVNGYLCGYLEISPFMVTLAMQTLTRGLTMMITDGSRIVVKNQAFNWLGGGQWNLGGFIVPHVSLVLVIVVAAALFWMRNFSMGIKLYAVGGNKTAAYASGIPVKFQVFQTYFISGLLCGLAAIITIGRSGSAQPLAGNGLEFDVITAVVMGGVSLLGGVGTMAGIFLGALLLGVLTLGINMLDIPSYSNYVIKGIFVLVAVLSNEVTEIVKEAVQAGKDIRAVSDNDKVLEKMKKGTAHTLELQKIKKSFSGVPALKGVSLKIQSGKVHALLGENGAGDRVIIRPS